MYLCFANVNDRGVPKDRETVLKLILSMKKPTNEIFFPVKTPASLGSAQDQSIRCPQEYSCAQLAQSEYSEIELR